MARHMTSLTIMTVDSASGNMPKAVSMNDVVDSNDLSTKDSELM